MERVVCGLILAALGDMPKHARGVINVAHAESPRLDGRGFWRFNPEYLRQIQSLDMLPPCVEVIDHHLHHAVFGPFFFVISLQDESACAHAENGNIAVE
jgi:hypothetical protein